MTETTQEEASLGDRSGNNRCADQANHFFQNGVVDPSLVILNTFLPQNIAQNPADASQLLTNR